MDFRELYAMLETPTLWEGRIQVTALIALFRSVDDAFGHPECIESVPSSASPWRMGGLVLTDLMLYIVCVADPEEVEEQEALEQGGGNVHIELEDVADSITSLDVYDRSAVVGRTTAGDRAPMVVLKVNTFTHELSFVVLSETVFDNVGVGEVVHHFGILPAVTVNHHVYSQLLSGVASPATKPALRKVSGGSSPELQRSKPSTNAIRPAFDSVSPERRTPSSGSSSLPMLLLAVQSEESSLRLCIERDESSSRLDTVASLGSALLRAQLEWQLTILEEAKAMNTNIVLGEPAVENGSAILEKPASEAVRQLLENQERVIRVKTDKYLRDTKDLRARQRICERNADLTQARETEQALRNQLADQESRLHGLGEAMQTLRGEKQSIEDELNDFKRREATVIEKARRREAELHSQLEALRKQQQQQHGGAVVNGQSPGSSSDGSPLPPPTAPPPAIVPGRFGTAKLQLFGRQQ